ncbi:L-type lectin-domain containing receptor kinase VIII.2-like [Solanum pennellii]|uniref:L-type lectin-domain containing receptor kinase VIII.2-like n=1 Tax=Solanum pennellii TaxID=28526 RepID=A0ABM1GFL0_SOLPN|nr:L-type lectin-domain containing receptor kinase VIII.2-like [Solanum pennellii]XP_015070403.1 L-type lectin-domain containing receptor kinase VIII.2-like [Solanum pennellii]XP_015070426.1 L-type lectin-domain containing receptor kinase VIII.2-like [Solanum pennellii]XP_015070427.1 L-type lectin-domain containing receptor kinase VIII.2-like [Solanum pennellii]
MDYFFWFFFSFAILVNSYLGSSMDGPSINVTKHISFRDFSSINPRLKQDVTLLGSVIVSDEKKSVQIPDPEREGDDLKHLAGRAIYSSPIRFFDPQTQTPASFETTFSFQFEVKSYSGNEASDQGKYVGGSGLTFIIVPDELTVGRAGPWLGMLNDLCDEDYKTVAIEFDTRKNPEFGDPNDNHLGINLGSIVSTAAINASDAGVQLNDGSVHRVWISYDGRKRFVEIRLAPDGRGYPSKPVYSGLLDLSPYLNEYMFVGFSAATGNHTQIHNILSWNFTSISQASLRIPSTETCQNKIMLQNSTQSENLHRKTPNSFFIFLAVVILLVVVLINLYFSSYKRDNNSDEAFPLPEKKQRPRPPNKARRFTIAEISIATRNFSELQILGSDEKSITYKATILNGCNVVVKRFLTQFFNTHGFEKRQFHKEIKAITRIRHPNLVPIRGWCYDNQETIIVYDFIPNGSLDKWLFGVGVLPWTRRFKVLKDLADSLVYLHSKQLAHKNVKSSSVFLDVSFRAVVGDFGFVLTSAGSTRFEAMVSQTADVFEFGVVVLEIIAGRSWKSNPGERDLLDLAWAMHEVQQKETLVDRRMGAVVNLEQAIRALDIGLLCTLNENKGRPTMEEVVEFLNMEKPIPELPSGRPVCLFPYSSTTGLCSGYACTTFK